MKLSKYLSSTVPVAFATLGLALSSQAAVTSYLSAGTTCVPGNNSAIYSTGGPALQVSLCVTTTTEAVCGASFKLQAAPGQDGVFNITARTLPAAFNYANNNTATFPFPLVNSSTFDAGGGTPDNLPVPGPLTNQLLATLTLAPTAGATAASYVISVDPNPLANFVFVENGSPCATNPVLSAFPPTTFTMSLAAPLASQTIAFGALPAAGFSLSPQAINPAATASSGLPITYSSQTPAVCSVSGSTFTSLTLGTCTIAANQAGNTSYSAAPEVTQSFAINPGVQAILFGSLPEQALGTPPIGVAASATSGLPVTITSLSPAVCTTSGTNGTTVTLLSTGRCSLQGTQAGSATFTAALPVTVSFNVIASNNVSLSSSSNPSSYRSMLTLTAQVSGTAPTGTVTFQTNLGTTLCAGVPLVSATATCPVPGHLNVTSPIYFMATYSGDAFNPGNTGSLQQMVNTNTPTLTVTTLPTRPLVGATVELKALVAGKNLSNKVQFNENGAALPDCGAVNVSMLAGATDIGVANCAVKNVTAGTHNYVVTYMHENDAGFEQVIVPVTPLSAPADFTDMWWAGSGENGWGLSIVQHGGIQFIVLYVYDANGKPVWYVLPNGTWNADHTAYSGALYQPNSSPYSNYLASQFQPGGAVGNATIRYAGNESATLTYNINGASGSKTITRQPYAADETVARMQVSDMWWGGNQENGWGLSIDQHGRTMFPVWYTYDAAGNTVFYVVPGGAWNGSSFTGDMYSTVSSAWLGTSYDPTQLAVSKVGTMTLDFSDQSNAVMTYTFVNLLHHQQSLTQKKAITRQSF